MITAYDPSKVRLIINGIVSYGHYADMPKFTLIKECNKTTITTHASLGSAFSTELLKMYQGNEIVEVAAIYDTPNYVDCVWAKGINEYLGEVIQCKMSYKIVFGSECPLVEYIFKEI